MSFQRRFLGWGVLANRGPDPRYAAPVTDTSAIEDFLGEARNVVVASVRPDGRPHLSPNWFLFDGAKFFVSTTRSRAKYRNFRRDARIELAIDDSLGYRAVLVSGTVEIREEIEPELAMFRAIREKYGRPVPSDTEHLLTLSAEGRVMLVISPDRPIDEWVAWGFD